MYRQFIFSVLASGLVLGATSAAQAEGAADWSGFYLGVHGGYALDTASASTFGVGPGTLSFGGFDLDGTYQTETTRLDALFGTVSAGYSLQHDAFVFGGEIGFSLGGFSKSESMTVDLNFDDGVDTVTGSYNEQLDYSLNWLTTARAKVGYAFDDFLVFARGGIAFADAHMQGSARLTATSPTIPLDIDLPGSSSASQLLIGPTIGLGLQYRVSEMISVSAEYDYFRLPDVTVPSPGAIGLLTGGNRTTNSSHHQIRAGLNFHF